MLDIKSEENIKVVKHYLNKNDCYNAVAGRLYYSVFQKVKYYFESNGISYNSYRNENDHRDYSHGSIQNAIKKEILKIQKKEILSSTETTIINYYDSIYKLRREADYTNKMIKRTELEDIYELTKELLEYLTIKLGAKL